ncbi:SMP-30/gluconolactonase/LRE family protein [Nocardia concava]|uniref:SMP-30/gluconolactonase/LRE family protein n=1 Tax=Nocardia concava TaxID=257281 RepID=UPI0006849408|nr:SMP-30/gluconolactonase/LRE family protein [Nocardia concava]
MPQSDSRARAIGAVIGALLAAATTLAGPAAADSPATTAESCSTAKVAMGLPTRAPLLDWSENLAFGQRGDIWIARSLRNVVERYDHDGRLVASVPVTGPGAVRLGSDGLLYVTYGNSPIAGAAKQGGVVRFDPEAPAPQPEVFVSGLGQANGAAFDRDGNLYVADTSTNTVERIHADGTVDADWTERARNALAAMGSGADGVVADGDVLYVTLLESSTARVVAMPIADPGLTSVAVDLAPAPLSPPLLPDDLAIGADGALYIATGTGQLVRADPIAHTSCTLLSIEPLTSVAVNPDDTRTLILGTENGDVAKTRVH